MSQGTSVPQHDASRRLRWAIWFGLLGVWCGSISAINRVSPDLYHEMALFREALAAGSVPTRDVFAYTPTVDPCVHHEWGAGAVFYALSVTMGSAGLTLLKYGGALLAGVGCWVLAKRRGGSDEVFALLAPVAILCGCIGFFSVRAQMFTLLFTLCLLHLLEQDRQGRRGWVLVWLPLYVVWLNMHGGFLVGVGLFGIYALGRGAQEFARHRSLGEAFQATRHLLVVVVAMAMLFPANPYGWNYAPYLWHALRLDRPFIAEWQAIWHFPRVLLIYVISWLPLLYVMRRQLRGHCADLLMILVPAALAFQHVRHLSIYAVVWACYVPALVEPTALGQAMRQTRPPLPHGSARAMDRARHVGSRASRSQPLSGSCASPRHEPMIRRSNIRRALWTTCRHRASKAVRWFRSRPAHLCPGNCTRRCKVSCDGRYEVAYPSAQVQELWDFYASQRDWQQILERYPPDVVFVPRSNPLENLLEQTPAADSASPWGLVYRDDGYSLYARQDWTPRLPAVDRSGQPIVGEFP